MCVCVCGQVWEPKVWVRAGFRARTSLKWNPKQDLGVFWSYGWAKPGAKESLGPSTGCKTDFWTHSFWGSSSNLSPMPPQGQVALGAGDGGQGRLRASNRAVLGDSESAESKVAGGWWASERMAVSLRMTVGRTLHQVSTRLPRPAPSAWLWPPAPSPGPSCCQAPQAPGRHPCGLRAGKPSASCRRHWR